MTANYKNLYSQMVQLQNRHWWFRVHYALIRDMLRPYLKPRVRLLDIGCGPGVGTDKIPRSVHRVLLDLRLLALSYCKHGSPDRVCSDADFLPLKSDCFDIVVCSDLLHQCDVKEPQKVAREAYRVCRPGGIILLVEPGMHCLFGPHDEVENGCRRFTTLELINLFGNHPVSLLRKTYLHMLMFLPAFTVRRFFSRFSSRRDTDLALGNRLTNFICFLIESAERGLNRFFNFPFGTSAAVLVKCEKPR